MNKTILIQKLKANYHLAPALVLYFMLGLWSYRISGTLSGWTLTYVLSGTASWGIILFASSMYPKSRWLCSLLFAGNCVLLLFISLYFSYFRCYPSRAVWSLISQVPAISTHISSLYSLYLVIGFAGLAVAITFFVRRKPVTYTKKKMLGLVTALIILQCMGPLHALVMNLMEKDYRGKFFDSFVQSSFYYKPLNGVKTFGLFQYYYCHLKIMGQHNPGQVVDNPLPSRQVTSKISKAQPNIIVIQVESLDRAILHRTSNSKEVTPFLNMLTRDALFFSNFFSVHGAGGSADAETAALTGILPLPTAPTMSLGKLTGLPSIAHDLKKAGYTNEAFHGNTREFWNRGNAYLQLGFDTFHGEAEYTGIAQGFKSADHEFFNQTIPKLKQLAQKNPFLAYVITQTSHGPWNAAPKTTDNQSFNYPNTTVNNYWRMMNYVDLALYKFIEELRGSGLLQNTYVLIYGDHTSTLRDDNYVALRHPEAENVPLFIITPDHLARTFETFGSHMDIAPTIRHLAGLQPDHRHIGRSLLMRSPDRLFPISERGGKHAITPRGLITFDALPDVYQGVVDYSRSYFQSRSPIQQKAIDLRNCRMVLHALGAVDGKTYLNSPEALKINYQRGFRYAEVDLLPTKDGKLVCIHDGIEKRLGIDRRISSYTLAELLEFKLDDRFSIMSFEQLCDRVAKDYPDLCIITDLKADMQQWVPEILRCSRNMKERLILQVYNPKELSYLKQHSPGVRQVIFTLYRSNLNDAGVLDTCKTYKGLVGAICMSAARFSPTLVKGLNDLNIPVLVHTVNNPQLMNVFYQKGVTGIYTDATWTDDLLLELRESKTLTPKK